MSENYKIQLSVNESDFLLKAESYQDQEVFSNTFKPNYIEQMTRRTGCYKSYDIFVKMLKNVVNWSCVW